MTQGTIGLYRTREYREQPPNNHRIIVAPERGNPSRSFRTCTTPYPRAPTAAATSCGPNSAASPATASATSATAGFCSIPSGTPAATPGSGRTANSSPSKTLTKTPAHSGTIPIEFTHSRPRQGKTVHKPEALTPPENQPNNQPGLTALPKKIENPDLRAAIQAEMDNAEAQAWNALARSNFYIFGYWAASWVRLNRLGGFGLPNPFNQTVQIARRTTGRLPQPAVAETCQADTSQAPPDATGHPDHPQGPVDPHNLGDPPLPDGYEYLG